MLAHGSGAIVSPAALEKHGEDGFRQNPVGAGLRELDGLRAMGARPRASIYLTKAAKAHAGLQGRGYATPHDVKNVAPDVLRHRVVLTYEAAAEGKTAEDVIDRILVQVLVP